MQQFVLDANWYVFFSKSPPGVMVTTFHLSIGTALALRRIVILDLIHPVTSMPDVLFIAAHERECILKSAQLGSCKVLLIRGLSVRPSSRLCGRYWPLLNEVRGGSSIKTRESFSYHLYETC